MPHHALIVNEKTIDFIEQVNGGLRPADECMTTPTWFVHPDRLDDVPQQTQLMTDEDFRATYKDHECADDNCNIVVKK